MLFFNTKKEAYGCDWHDRQFVNILHLTINVAGLALVWILVFKATFNNISAISWWSVLLMEKTGVHGENHRHIASHWQTVSHNVASSTPRHGRDAMVLEYVLAYMTCLAVCDIIYLFYADLCLHVVLVIYFIEFIKYCVK
jgi:hypothetical protein